MALKWTVSICLSLFVCLFQSNIINLFGSLSCLESSASINQSVFISQYVSDS